MTKKQLKNYIRLLEEEVEHKSRTLQFVEMSNDFLRSENMRTKKEREELIDEITQLYADIEGMKEMAGKPVTSNSMGISEIAEKNIAVTYKSELEYWSFMELCADAELMWMKTGDPRKARPIDFNFEIHAVSYECDTLAYATPEFYRNEGLEIVSAAEFLEIPK